TLVLTGPAYELSVAASRLAKYDEPVPKGAQRAIRYLTNQAKNPQGQGSPFCVRTGSGSDRIRRNLRIPAELLDPVATAPGSDTMSIFLLVKYVNALAKPRLGLNSDRCYAAG